MKALLQLSVLLLAMTAPLTQAAAKPAAATAISDKAKLSVAREMIADWKARDWRKAADLFTDDGVLHSMMSEPVVGREAVYKRFAALGDGIQSITLDVSHLGAIDGRIYLERVDRFVYKGKSGAVPVIGVLIFRGNRIAEWREYYDRNQLLTEMGALQSKP